ncbi:hypothetical protein TNCV_2723751 [Trichonephila clavipes]|nr:hypothetical protein TNCV_2723751 [Trichonephila clavipes]
MVSTPPFRSGDQTGRPIILKHQWRGLKQGEPGADRLHAPMRGDWVRESDTHRRRRESNNKGRFKTSLLEKVERRLQKWAGILNQKGMIKRSVRQRVKCHSPIELMMIELSLRPGTRLGRRALD